MQISTGGRSSCRTWTGRATTLIDRDGDHVAVLIHDPALEEEPELLDGVQAAAGIALENAGSTRSCERGSRSSRARALGSSRRRSTSGSCSSATSTTARSSG